MISTGKNGFWCILSLQKRIWWWQIWYFCHFYSAYLESNLQGYSFDIFFSFAGGLGPSGPPLATPMCTCSTFITARSVAERGIAQASCPSVRPSVCLSVTLRYHGQIGWNSAKIISRLISVIFSLSAHPHIDGSSPKTTPPNFRRNKSGVWKLSIFDI